MSVEPSKDQMSSVLPFQDDTILSHLNHQVQQPAIKTSVLSVHNICIIQEILCMKKNLKDCYVEETEWNIVGFS